MNRPFEILGLIAVLIGLVFVGMELRQNTAAYSSQALLDLNLAANEDFRTLSTDEELVALLVKGLSDSDGLSAEEHMQYRSYWFGAFNLYEAAFLFREKGILTDQDYETWHQAACGTYTLSSVQHLVETGELKLSASFHSLLDKCPSEDDR